MKRIPAPILLVAFLILSACTGEPQETADNASQPAPEKAQVDPYFREPPSVSSDKSPQVITRKILQASQGDIWLATWNGLIRYDGTTFTNVTIEKDLNRFRAFSLLEDDQENIWMGTIGSGVYRYDGSTFTNLTTADGLVNNDIISMMQDSDKNIWFGTMGVTKYDGNTFTSFTKKDGFTNSDVNSISEAPDGSIWFGTRGALFHYDGETFVNFTEEHGLNITSYISTLVDRKGHLWFGGENGLFHFDGEKLRHPIQLSSFYLLEDSQGNIWYSGNSLQGEDPVPGKSVLNRFDPAAGLENILVASEQFEVEDSGMIFELTEGKDGSIWFGTLKGVGRLEGDTVQYY